MQGCVLRSALNWEQVCGARRVVGGNSKQAKYMKRAPQCSVRAKNRSPGILNKLSC